MPENEKPDEDDRRRLNIAHASREMLACDFRCEGKRVRGPLPIRLLAAVVNALKDGRVKEAALLDFLRAGDQESNLVPGAEIVTLERFALDRYLPKKAKPHLKERSYGTEVTQVRRLIRTLGTSLALHEVRSLHSVAHKDALLAQQIVNNTIRKDLFNLSRIVEYGVECGLIKKNLLPKVKGLPLTNRSAVWLRRPDIVKLLWAADRRTRSLILFLILTGARIKEALEFRATDIIWDRDFLWMPTEKRRGKSVSMRTKMRKLKISALGSRFRRLLRIMRAHPQTGSFFFRRDDGTPMHPNWAEDLIGEAVKKAGLGHLVPKEVVESGGFDHVIPHDLRRTFTMHRVIIGVSFNQLRSELGQIHAQSIQSYLDESENHDPSESIFFERPTRQSRIKTSASGALNAATGIASTNGIEPARPLLH